MTASRIDRALPFLLVLLFTLTTLASCSKEPDSNGSTTADMGGEDTAPRPEDAADGDVATDARTPPSDLTIDTLSGPVQGHYDEHGILHISCERDRDCFVAQGYFHARDRFLQMDLLRNQTRGRLSSMIGLTLGLDSDRFWRHRMMTRDGSQALEDAYFEAANERTKDTFGAYAEGVNAWLELARVNRRGERLNAEYESGILYGPEAIRDWTPQDSVTLYLQLAYTWSFGEDVIVSNGNVATNVGPDLSYDLVSAPNPIQSYMSDHSASTTLSRWPSAPDSVPDLPARLTPWKNVLSQAWNASESHRSLLFGRQGKMASNAWAVGPGKTADGKTLMANDPHLDMTTPSIWYLTHLHSKEGDLHVAGASVPAVPGIIIGHNERVAWGATVAVFGLADVYTETLTPDGLAVMRGEQRVELIRDELTIEGRQGDETTVEVEWVPDHGPVIRKDVENGTALSVKWVGHDVSNDIDFLMDLLYVETLDEANRALDPIRVLNVNWIVADVDGNIGWLPKAALPDRSEWNSAETPSWFPLPGDGSAEWGPYVEAAVVPTIINPPTGFIANTNNDFDDAWADGDPTNDGRHFMQVRGDSSNNARHQRAMELLAATDQHDGASVRAVSSDVYSHYGSAVLPEMLDRADVDSLSPPARSVYDTLSAWDYECPTGLDGLDPETASEVTDADTIASSAGCTAFHVLLKTATAELLTDELVAGGYPETVVADRWKYFERSVLNVLLEPQNLRGGESYADDVGTPEEETVSDWLTESFEETATALQDSYESSTPSDWIWGRIHYASLPSLLGLPQYSGRPTATPGGLYTLAKADPGLTSYDHVDGQSIRLFYTIDATGIRADVQLPGGQVHHPDSPFYDNLLDKWATFTPTPLEFDMSAVAPNAAATIEIKPAP